MTNPEKPRKRKLREFLGIKRIAPINLSKVAAENLNSFVLKKMQFFCDF